jgi:hypothetical protein
MDERLLPKEILRRASISPGGEHLWKRKMAHPRNQKGIKGVSSGK